MQMHSGTPEILSRGGGSKLRVINRPQPVPSNQTNPPTSSVMTSSSPVEVKEAEDVMCLKKFPVKNLVATAVETLRCKGVIDYLQNEGNSFFNEKHLKPYLATINFDTTTPYEDAWRGIQNYRNLLTVAYSKILSTHLIISTVEHTHEIPKKHQECQLHKAVDLKEFEGLCKQYFALPTTPANLIHIDPQEYTINLLNFFSELIYTSSIYNRSVDLINYARGWVSRLLDLVRAGQRYPFLMVTSVEPERGMSVDYYKMDTALAVAHTQTVLGGTTVGYPHLHFVIYAEASSDPKSIEKLLYNETKRIIPLVDVRVDGSKRQGNPTKALTYVLKNHSSKVVFESLERAKQDTTIIISYITSTKYQNQIYNILEHICPSDGLNKLTSNKVSKVNKSIPMIIYISREALSIAQSPTEVKENNRVQSDSFYVVDPEESKINKYVYIIQSFMIKNGYAICDGCIFKRVQKSKSCWNHFSSIQDFLEASTKDSELISVTKSMFTTITRWMNCSLQLDLEGRKMIEFPRVKLDYRVIEFGDFYYNLSTCSIYRTQRLYNTYLYIPEISLSNLTEHLTRFLDESIWPKQLRTSGVYHLEYISKLFEVCLKREIKGLVPVLVGDSNTGKSAIIRPFKNLFPPNLVGILVQISEHHIQDQVKSMELVIIEEGNGMLRSASDGASRGMVNLLLGGEWGLANKKLGGITQANFSETACILTINIEKKDITFYKNEPLLNRCYFIPTRRGSHNIIMEAYSNLAAKYESPLVFLFGGMCHLALRHNLSYIPNLPIYDTPELETAQGSNIPNTFPFTHNNLPSRCPWTQNVVIMGLKGRVEQLNRPVPRNTQDG